MAYRGHREPEDGGKAREKTKSSTGLAFLLYLSTESYLLSSDTLADDLSVLIDPSGAVRLPVSESGVGALLLNLRGGSSANSSAGGSAEYGVASQHI